MLDALQNAFGGSGWPYALLAYLVLGWGSGAPLWSALGALHVHSGLAFGSGTTRVRGDGLPYMFLLPNLIIFGLFTFAPFFINVGFSLTEGQSINFDARALAGDNNLQRLLAETSIDTGLPNREDDKFTAAVADTSFL